MSRHTFCRTIRNKFQWKLNQTTIMLNKDNAYPNAVCKILAISFRPNMLKYNFYSTFKSYPTYPCSMGPTKSIMSWPKRKRLFNIKGRHVTLARAQMMDALVSCCFLDSRSLAEASESTFCGFNCSELVASLDCFLKYKKGYILKMCDLMMP